MGLGFRSKKSSFPGVIEWGKPRASRWEGFFGERRWSFRGQLRDLLGDLDERNGLAVKFHSDRAIKLFHDTEALASEDEGGFMDSEGSPLPTDRVVPGDKTRLFEAEDILQTESLGDGTVKVFLG